MKLEIMFIELKTHAGGHDGNGPAWISRVKLADDGATIYWRDRTLRRGLLGSGNYIDTETGEAYLIAPPKRHGQDRFPPFEGEEVRIDEDIRQEYWTRIRRQPDRSDEEFT